MKCSKCHHNEASIYIEQNINGKSHKYHICGDCASQGDINVNLNFTDPAQALSAIHSFWFGPDSSKAHKSERRPVKTCPDCLLGFDNFKKTSMLGCAACYDAFAAELTEIFGKLQPADKHRGKIPKRAGAVFVKDRTVAELKERLSALIAAEEYEEAAKVRDEIRAVENHTPQGMEGEQ